MAWRHFLWPHFSFTALLNSASGCTKKICKIQSIESNQKPIKTPAANSPNNTLFGNTKKKIVLYKKGKSTWRMIINFPLHLRGYFVFSVAKSGAHCHQLVVQKRAHPCIFLPTHQPHFALVLLSHWSQKPAHRHQREMLVPQVVEDFHFSLYPQITRTAFPMHH